MNNVTTQLLFLVGYTAVFALVCVAFWVWRIKRRGEKPPVEFKLLRGPGESLRRRMAKSDEELIFIVGGAALAPIIAGLGMLQLLVWLTPRLSLFYGLMVTAIPAGVVLFFAGRFIMRTFSRYRNDRLGYLGERAVGEALEPLIASGYRVFHDVPAVSGKFKFNIDHVTVGPNGVFAIETKTRRKGRARSGFVGHEVTYDGRQLVWPWGEETQALKNAEDRAWWLNDWLNKTVGLNVVAQPVLVLPGWYVVTKGVGPVVVVTSKLLAGAIRRVNKRVLSAEQIDLIARQLDLLCRNVED